MENRMSKSEIYRKRVQSGERPSQDIMTPFELIKPCDFDSVITELQKANNELRKKRSKGQINEAYAATIERQDVERQKQAVKLNKLRQKSEKQQRQISDLQNSRKELKDLIQLTVDDLNMRRDDNGVVNISNFIWLRLKEVIGK